MFGKEQEWRERTSAKSQAGDEKVAFSHPTKNHPDFQYSCLQQSTFCKFQYSAKGFHVQDFMLLLRCS